MRTKSMRGVHVDFARYMNEFGDTIALGNAMLNARGDRIDRDGNVIQTRADISAAYHRTHSKTVKHTPLKAVETDFKTPSDAVKSAGISKPDDRTPKTRKIVDEQ